MHACTHLNHLNRIKKFQLGVQFVSFFTSSHNSSTAVTPQSNADYMYVSTRYIEDQKKKAKLIYKLMIGLLCACITNPKTSKQKRIIVKGNEPLIVGY